ncbi:MAG: SDR family oxidoreductase [Eubacterium sp.]|nr:SDR family oxidoreductase [Eubacterium sp.]
MVIFKSIIVIITIYEIFILKQTFLQAQIRCWQHAAVKYGSSGLRIVSISPGTFATPMGILEGEAASSLALQGALGRVGDPVEIARMMAFMVSDACSYLTGVDILYDGGSIAALRTKTAN